MGVLGKREKGKGEEAALDIGQRRERRKIEAGMVWPQLRGFRDPGASQNCRNNWV